MIRYSNSMYLLFLCAYNLTRSNGQSVRWRTLIVMAYGNGELKSQLKSGFFLHFSHSTLQGVEPHKNLLLHI